jgi:hypothetical protein
MHVNMNGLFFQLICLCEGKPKQSPSKSEIALPLLGSVKKHHLAMTG